MELWITDGLEFSFLVVGSEKSGVLDVGLVEKNGFESGAGAKAILQNGEKR